MELIDIIKALSHKNRLRIINLLNQDKLCVCELENIMDTTQSNVSRHLSKLKQVDLIVDDRNAQWVYYELNEKFLTKHPFVKTIIEDELEEEYFQKDMERLDYYQESGWTCEDLQEKDLF